MVAIVSGSGLGLELASNSILGDLVPGGAAAQGRSGERATVNVANGNLVLQDLDDHLVAHGPSVDVARTYNSLGQFSQAIDENGDRWTVGLYKSVRCTGQFNAAGSAIVRVDRDASESTYTFDAARGLYVSTDGAGAYDTIALDSSNDDLVWTDGATGLQERYDSKGSGQLLSVNDQNGNRTTYAYLSNGLLTSVTDSSGETTYLDYVGKLLKQIRTVVLGASGPQTLTSVRYTYDDAKRLDSVTVDLTPADNSVTDLCTYKTTYAYDAFSGGVQSIRESDGTSQSFTYVKVADEYRVASVSDGEGNTTRFTYDTSNRRSTVTDPLGFVTVYDYDAKGQLTAVTGPATGGGRQVRTFGYDDAGNVTLTVDPEGRAVEMTYDANGNQVSRRDSAGNTVFRTFGSQPGALLTETVFGTPDPDGVGPAQAGEPLTTRYVYDSLDRLRFAISPEGRVTETRYNGFGERIANLQYTAALYATGSLAVDAAPSEANMAAWVAGIDRSQCVRSDMTYDFRGQLASTTTWSSLDAAGNGIADGSEAVTRQIMDQSGRLLSTINPDNSQTRVAYDGLGRVLSTIDSLGNVTLTQYDDARNQTLVRLANGLITSAHFDRAGRLVGVSKYDASMGLGETRYAYDADGRLRMTQDPTGVRHFMLYDEAGRKVADIDGDGSLVEYRYNGNDQVVRTIAYATAVDTGVLIDAQGKPAEIALASIRPLQSAQDRSTLKVYDDANRLVKSVDEVGFVTELIYDGASRITSSIRYARPISAGYFGDAPTTAEIAPVGSGDDRVTRNFHDSDGLLRATLDGEGYLVEYRYDARGQLSEQVSWANAVAVDARASGTLSNLIPLASAGDIHVRILYNLRGQEAARIDGEGYLTERVYGRNGNLTQLVRYATPVRENSGTSLAALRPARNRDDQASNTLYDSLDRLILATDAEGTQTAYAYDAVGNLVSKTTAANTDESRTLTSRYDAQGRLVGELSGEGSALLTGNQTQEQVDAIWQSYGSRYTCDAAGRRTSATDANGNRTLFYYDADSRLSFTVSPLGEVEEHRYNALNQLTGTIRYGTRIATAGLGGGLADAGFRTLVGAARNAGLDSQTSVVYYRNGAVSSSTDELGNVTDYLYDAFGDLTVRVRSGNLIQNLIETFAYDRRGLQTTAVADPDGLKLSPSTEYDAFGRAIRTVDGNGNVHATSYDRLGRVIASTDPQGGIRRASYDAIGRVLTSTDATGHTTSYRYDADARSVVMTTAEGIVVVNLHNRNGQTQEIADGRGVSTQYHYDRNGNLVQTVSVPGRNQIETGASFDHANRLIDTVDANGNRVHYTYDAASRVLTRQLDPNGLNLTSSYGYDAKGQQIVSTDPNGAVTLTTFDLKGQALSQTVDPAGLNLTTRYTHDALGNTLTVSSPGGAITEYVYDALGRRIEEHVDPTGLNLTRRFGYDSDGNLREVEDANGQVTRTVYDANDRLVYTVDAQGDVTENRYDLAGRVTGTTRYATAIDAAGLTSAPTVEQVRARLIAAPGRDAVENRIVDADGRLLVTADGSGAVTRYAYDASGNVIERISYANAIDPAAWETAAPTPDPARDRHVRTVYDALNRAIYTIDGIGAVVEQRYDSNGNVVERIAYAHAVAPESPATAPAMAAAVERIADPANDEHVRSGYDAANRLTWRVDGMGAVTQLVYDANGNLVKRTAFATSVAAGMDGATVTGNPAQDQVTRHVYDKDNRQVYAIDAQGHVTETRYDRAGNAVATTQYAEAIDLGNLPSLVATSDVQARLHPDVKQDRVTRFGFDAANRVSIQVDAEGYVTQFDYSGVGSLVRRTRYATALPAGVALDRTAILAAMQGDGRLVQVETWTWDAQGRLLTSVDALGHAEASEWDGVGNRTGFIDRLGRASLYDYDAAGHMLRATDAEGAQTTYAYDVLGNQVSKTTAANTDECRTLTSRYDAQGRLVAELSGEGSALLTGSQTQEQVDAIWQDYGSRYTYDAAGRRTSATDANGNRTLLYYDVDSRLTFTVNALGEVEEHRYNTLNQLTGTVRYGSRIATAGLTGGLADAGFTSLIGAARNAGLDSQTAMAYNLSGAVSSSTDELGTITQYDYDAFGELSSRTTPIDASHGLIETWAYDRRGLQTRTVADPDGLKLATSTDYDAFGRAIRSVDGNGNVHATSYDRLGRVIASTDPQGGVRSASYDAIGRVLTSTDATGNTTSYRYDADARSVVMTTAEGIVVTTVHNWNGQTQSVTDGRGVTTQYEYDHNGNLVQTGLPQAITSQAGGSKTSASHDHANRLIETVDATGIRVAYRYDAANRMLGRQLDPSGLNLSSSYRYDAKGQQIASTDANGIVTLTTFDLKGQVLTQTVDPTGLNLTTRYTRDARGNTLTVTSPGGTVTQYIYDALGRRIEEHLDPAGRNIARRYSYDQDGNVVGLKDPLGHITRYAYDANDRLVYTVDPQGDVTENRYDGAGHLSGTTRYVTAISLTGLALVPTLAQVRSRIAAARGHDVVENRLFDKDGRLAATVDGAGAVTRFVHDGNGNVIERIAYANPVDPAAWDTAAPAPDPTRDRHERTVYDALNRAIYTIDGIGAVVEQRHDGNGNVVERIAYARTVAPESPATASALADAVARIADAAHDEHVRNSYDAANRLTWSADGVGAVTQSVYDANGNLVRQIAYSTTIAPDVDPASIRSGPADRILALRYDAANRLTYRTDPAGAVEGLAYDANGNLVTRIAYANAILPGADGAAVIADPAHDRVTRMVYNSANQQVYVIDAQGYVTGKSFDALGQLVRIARHGQVLAAGVAQNLQAISAALMADASQDQVTSFVYDAGGRVLLSVDAMRNIETSTWDAAGNRLSFTNGNGSTWRYDYDAAGRVIAETAPAAEIAAVAIGTAGTANVVSSITASALTRMQYDAFGKLTVCTEASGRPEERVTRNVFDANGRLVYSVDAQGDVSEYRYDALGRLTGTTRYATAISLAGLASATGVAQVRSRIVASSGHDLVENRVYGSDGRLSLAVDGAGAVTRYRYDIYGNVIERIAYANRIDPANWSHAAPTPDALHDRRERTVYDALNHPLYTIDGAGAVVEQHYDRNGNVIERIAYANSVAPDTAATADSLALAVAAIADAARDAHVRNTWDAANRLTWRVEGTGAVTQSVYDSHGNLVREVAYALAIAPNADPASVTHSASDRIVQRTYDADNREVFRTDPAGAVTKSLYDAVGNLVTRIEYATVVAPGADGATVVADPARDRVTRMVYDAANRQVYGIDAQGFVTRERYDGLGHLASSVRYAQALPAGVALKPATIAAALQADTAHDQAESFVTDSQGHVLTHVDAMGHAEFSTWDGAGNKLSFTNASGSTWRYEYDAAGRVISETAPAVELTTLVAAAAGTLALASVVTAAPVTRMQYDAFGNVTSRTEAAGRPEERTTRYVYDARGRQVKTIYPAVNVYNAAGDDLLHNGLNGLAARIESQDVVLSSEVTYDALGNAVANRDVSGNFSYKAYDAAGRVRYEVDAEGYVTGYARNTFGDATQLLRHAAQTSLPSAGAAAPDVDRIEAAINAPGVDHRADRLLTTTYDQLGRAVEIVEPVVFNVDADAAGRSQGFMMGKTTRQAWDAFGQLTSTAVLADPLTNSWSVTRFWYDARGNQVASVDALGYVTESQYDAEGNVTQRTEYAQAAGGWNGPGTTPTSADDRITRTSYDLNNRKISETRVNVEFSDGPNGASIRGDLTSTYGYDAVGNLTRTTDAAGAITFTYYDALGRITAVAAPTRNAMVDGALRTVTPLTQFQRDVYGNVVSQTEYATGAISASAISFVAPAPTAADHVVRTLYDTHGHAIQSMDGLGNSRFTSWDAAGRIAKQWQAMTGNDGIAHTVFKAIQYDKLGQQLHVISPANNTVLLCGLKVSTTSSHAVSTGVDESGMATGVAWTGTNSVTLAWSTVIDPRGGAVRVDIDYVSSAGGAVETDHIDESGATLATFTYPTPLNASRSQVWTAGQASGGVTLSWTDENGGPLGFDHLNSFDVYQQDASGQWVLKWTQAGASGNGSAIATYTQDVAGVNDTATVYNAFGEVTRQSTNGGAATRLDYDNAGRVWRTNAGDGVTRVELYDAQGAATAEIVSANLNLQAYGSAEQVARLADVRRTDTGYDLLGRQVRQVQAERNGVRPVVTRTLDRWGNVLSVTDPRSAYWVTTYRYNASNQVVVESKPDADGNQGAASPTTQSCYDRTGNTVAVRDANGNLNGQVFNPDGTLAQALHADGGIVSHYYDVFGNQVRMVDAMGNAVDYRYDAANRLTQITRGTVAVYSVDGNNLVQYQGTRALTQTVRYDQLGHTLAVTNGNGETTSYGYDLAGNVTSVTQPLGDTTRAVFNAQGRKTAEVDANGFAATWRTDHFGRLLSRTDLGGADYQQSYDYAGQLVNVTNTRGQNIGYSYDGAGQLIRIDDSGINEQSLYAWDAAGNRVHETTVQDNVAVQDNALGFDALNRLTNLSAQGGVQMHFDYDRMGNRLHEHIDFQASTGARAQDLWYAYDAMNRQILVDGALNNNASDLANLQNGQGHIVAWDRNGNRISDTFVGNHVTQSGGQTVDGGVDESGNPISVTTPVTWGKAVGVTSETYRYDVNNRMVEVQRDGVMIDTRYYDGADRVVQTGPAATLAQGYVEQLNNGPVGNGSETRINRYDADGHLLHQQVAKSDGAPKYDIDYQYDAAGNVVAYTDVTHGDGGYTASYAYTQLRQDGYKEATITGARTDNTGAPGQTTDSYDVNGTLVGITDSTKAENNRGFISDAAGIVLQKTQQGHVQRQIVVGGQVVAELGSGLDPRQPIDKDGNQTYIDYQNFNLGYRAIDANYPTAEAGSTVVQAGDTLQGIAQKAYGDAQLWYLIADANGIQGNSDLRVGQTLQLPNRVGTVHNNAGAFKPYEAGKILGDTTPNLPAPSGGDDCGGFGQILVVVIAVVVTVLTGSPILASIISQGVGMATGVQKDFSWSAVALAAIGGAVSNGLEGVAPLGGEATSFGNTVARAAIGNAVTQGIGVATGLQKEFSWVGVAAAGVGAGVGYGVSEALGITSNGVRTTAFGKAGFGEQVVKAGLTGFAAGLATAVARGGRISVTQVAVDAFGNALGNSLGALMSSAGQQDPALGKTFAEDRARRLQANPLLASDPQADTTSAGTPPPGMEGRPLINSVVFNGGSNYEAQWRINQSLVGGTGNASAPANGSDDPNSVNYRNGPDIESDNADRNGTGPIRTMTSVTVNRGDSVEKLARDLYGDQWRAGMATLIRDNGIKLNQWGSPIIRDGQSLGAWDLSVYSDEGLQRLGRASNAIEANNSRGLSAKADMEAQKAALEAQAAADSERYREASRFASMSRPAAASEPAQATPSGGPASPQGDAVSNRYGMIAAAALGGEYSLIADGLSAEIASGYAGPGKAIADPQARGIAVANDTLHDLKESAKDLIVKGGSWGLQRGGIWGGLAYHVASAAYVVDDIFQPSNLLDVGLLAGGPAIGKAVGAGVSVLNKLPVLGTDVGEVAAKTVYELGESLANRIEGMQDSLGLRLGVVESNAARLRIDFSSVDNVVPGFYRADPSQLRFSQSNASPFFSKGGTIDSLIEELRIGKVTPEQVGNPLQVVMYEGKPFSLDNRRLVAFNQAGVSEVPIQVVSLEDRVIADRFFKRLYPIGGDGLKIVITPTSGRAAAERLLRDFGLIKGAKRGY